ADEHGDRTGLERLRLRRFELRSRGFARCPERIGHGIERWRERFGDVQEHVGCLPAALGSAELRQFERIESAAYRLGRTGLRFTLRLGRLALDREQVLV